MSGSRSALVTGAGGFVGAVLARRLVTDGHDVHVLVRPHSDRWRLRDLNAVVHEVDITDVHAVNAAVRSVRPSWIFHLAAYGAYEQQRQTDRMFEVNVRGTMNLVRAGLECGFRSFVHAGSSSEYETVDHAPREDERLQPGSDYAVTKAAATLYCQSVAEREDAPIATLRIYSAYGPYEEPTRFLPALVLEGLEGKLPPLVAPSIARDFVYVEDVAEAFLLAAESGASRTIYNVGTGTQVTIAEAVAAAKRLLGIKEEPRWGSMSNRSWDTTTWVANPERIRTELGWAPRNRFKEGLGRTIEWFRSSPDMRRFYQGRRRTPPPAS